MYECMYDIMTLCKCGSSLVQLVRSWAPSPGVGGSIPTWALQL